MKARMTNSTLIQWCDSTVDFLKREIIDAAISEDGSRALRLDDRGDGARG